MFTGVFKDRTPQRAADAREALKRLLQSRSLHPHRFIRQASIGPFVVEHTCRERAVIVELRRGEGNAPHRMQGRLQFLKTLGFKVVLLSAKDVLHRPHEALAQVQAALK